MTTIRTDLRETLESARRIRFEPGSGILATNVQKAIEEVSTAPTAIDPTSVTTTPYAVTPADTLLWVDTSGGAITITLPAAATRLGKALEIKDITGNANANNISIVPNGAETIDGLAPMIINTDFGGWTLYPKDDGTGWTTQV